MQIEIYQGTSKLYDFSSVLSASLVDRLSGERTLDFSVLASRSQKLLPGMTAHLDGQIYSIVRVARQLSNGLPITTAQCEHISYLLNDEQYNLVTFVYEGTPLGGLNRLLSGTPFSVGVCEATTNVEVAFTEGELNRRNALMRFIDTCGCEVEYDGYKINLRKHRGSTVRKVLMDGRNVTNLSVTLDSREDTQSYEISLFKMADLEAGDEVNITYRPMGVSVDTRIVAITYNPFYRYTVRVEVGDYVPNLLAATADRMEGIKQEFRAANGKLESTIQKMDGSLSSLTQTVSGFDTRITTAEGSVSELKQTVGGFDARIKTAEGNVAQLSLTVGGFNTRITATEEGLEGAETHISAIEQYAKSIRLSVTNGETSSSFKLTADGATLSSGDIKFTGYVTFAGLSGGTTTIDGACIKTGKITADRIDVGSLKVSKIYDSTGKKTAIDCSSSATMYIGGNESTSAYSELLIKGTTITFNRWGDTNEGISIHNASSYYMRPGTSSLYSLGDATHLWAGCYTNSVTITPNSSSLYGMTLNYNGIIPAKTEELNLGSSSYKWNFLYVYAIMLDGVRLYNNRLSYSTDIYAALNSSKQFVPQASTGYYLGSSTYPWQYAYITNLYINGTQFNPSNYATTSSLSGYATTSSLSSYAKASSIYRLYAGGTSTSYYLTYNSSRQLVPSHTGSSYGSYIGTSSYPFYWGYFTGLTVQGGTLNLGNSSAYLGFFGVSASRRKSVSTCSTSSSVSASTVATSLNNLINALKGYGLIS